MFNQVLAHCSQNILAMPCCHPVVTECNCHNCLNEGYYGNNPDTYDCKKKNNTYVQIYGLSYINEIYSYLDKSQIIESFVPDNINILSLGCGFCPDYYAISRYVTDKGLAVNFQYYGLEKSLAWDTTRPLQLINNCRQADLLNPFSFNFHNIHIIMLNKVFSTLYRNGLANVFLSNLVNEINNSMQHDAILAFNDINTDDRGRDDFDKSISQYFNPNNVKRYYTGGFNPYFSSKKIDVNYPDHKYKSVFFEYRK
jgi:hypothetical protein